MLTIVKQLIPLTIFRFWFCIELLLQLRINGSDHDRLTGAVTTLPNCNE
jgi:hypothetical protein